MIALFVYGTLMDKEIQCALYGRIATVGPAFLTDYARFRDWDGYYYADPEPGGTVCGVLLGLTLPELAMTDLWEEVPRYVRRTVTVYPEHGRPAVAQLYIASHPRLRVPAHPGTLAAVPRHEVLASALQLRTEVAGAIHGKGQTY